MSPSEYQEAEKMFKLQPNHQNECWHCLFLETMDFVKIGFNFQLSVVTLQYFKFKKNTLLGFGKDTSSAFSIFFITICKLLCIYTPHVFLCHKHGYKIS